MQSLLSYTGVSQFKASQTEIGQDVDLLRKFALATPSFVFILSYFPFFVNRFK